MVYETTGQRFESSWAYLTMDSKYMALALDLAEQGAQQGEVPVGAIVVDSTGATVGQGFDQREALHDPTARAERHPRCTTARLETWRLPGCTLYVTLEPCPMCMGAILSARLEWLSMEHAAQKSGAVESVLELARPWLSQSICT